MTGGGATTLAFAKETGFMGSLADDDGDGNPDYYLPGRNPTINNLSLQRVLQRLRTPQNAEAIDSLASSLEGAFGVTFAMSADVQSDVHEIVFPNAGQDFDAIQTAFSRWFVGMDYLSSGNVNTVERVLKGTIPLEYAVQYQQDAATVQVSLTMGYADEEKNTTVTPGSITGPTDGNDVPFHGTDLTIDAASVQKLQSASLTISNISRFQRGPDPVALDAVVAAPQATLDAQAIYNTDDYLELAYGASGSTTTQDQLSNVSGTLSFDVGGTTAASYDLPKLTPDTYDWEDVVNGEADMTDSVTYHVNGGITAT